MKNVKITLLFLILVALFAVTAEEDDNYDSMIGGIPAMTWEDGGQDFFVMFNSNLDDRILLSGENNENPQGDTCLDSSSFTLDSFHIPEDAYIEKAYLVWTGAVAPDRIDEPTDNEVQLSFTQTNDSSVKLSTYILSGEYGRRLTDLPSFDFEGIRFMSTTSSGCSETSYGEVADLEVGYFTYRADITDFFNRIYEINKTNGHIEGTGEYYGTYTLSDLECTDHDAYKCNGSMVSAWAVFFIYRSKSIDRTKKIYFYNGLAFAYGLTSRAEVRDLELAPYPDLRIATMVADGDTGLTNANLPTDEITVKGITPDAEAQGAYRLTDKCNPRETVYTEIFNSVSSVPGWDTDEIECYGAGWRDINFGIDVDTFDLDSAQIVNLQAHLPKYGEGFDVNFGVNQDAIFTNFMALSVDIKGSRFDIPDESEKYSCSCPPSASNTYNDYYCQGNGTNKEFYYLIKIQNWGDDEAKNVTVSDELDPQLEYVSGTTEFATKFNDYGNGTDWEPIPDKNGGKFPLSGNGVKISDRMEKCNSSTRTCKDTILVRYKVRPKQGIAANYVFSNIALISDSSSGDTPYKTNNSYPLKLKPGSCVSDAVCANPTAEMCGGLKEEEPEPVEKECGEPDLPVCPTGYVCENFKCVDDQTFMCSDAEVEAAIGKNSPKSDNMIIIPKDNYGQPLVVGQFTLQASGCEEGKVFNFDKIKVRFDTNRDEGFEFSEPELIYDTDGNGHYDDTIDIIVSSKGTWIDDNYMTFALNANMKKYFGKSLNHFLVRTKFSYKSATVPPDTSFRFYFKDEDLTVNSGYEGTSISVENGEINFPEFYLEPTGDYFIVTASSDSPEIPHVSEMNINIPVLQLRTKSMWEEVILWKLRIKAPGNAVKFGGKNGITAVSLWVDTNGDGIGDIRIAEKTRFETESGEEGASEITFEHWEFAQGLYYKNGEEKNLIIYVDFDMKKAEPPMYGMITIPTGGITLDSPEATIYKLPVRSQVFTYACPDGDLECDDTETDSEPKQGELGAECYPDRTCNDGLLCRSSDNTCFEPEPVKSSGCSVLTLD